ncbi:MAG: ferritin-like domain-containing protein [Proteobacteria bacterium]|nr:ferritin-like domain-containing protein [Pseudomonadota bacterium]
MSILIGSCEGAVSRRQRNSLSFPKRWIFLDREPEGDEQRIHHINLLAEAGRQRPNTNDQHAAHQYLDVSVFLRDVKTLRAQAKLHLENGAVTEDYGLDVAQSIALLQTIVATELVCVLRYTLHAVTVVGITSESASATFREYAKVETEHMMMAAERIDQLGGTPNFDPEGAVAPSCGRWLSFINGIACTLHAGCGAPIAGTSTASQSS